MKDYVWALHDFLPQEADEISFKAGDRIEVAERDDLYQDGWWKGINPQGKEGLFPKAYTTDHPPSDHRPAIDRSQVAFPDRDIAAPLKAINEEPDSQTNGIHTVSSGHADERERTLSTGEAAMQATLTDVQKAIEQLGRTDGDGSRSFSFRSSHDDYTDRSDPGTDAESEVEDGMDWHRNTREKLAIRAQQENQQRMREAGPVPSTPMRITAPPIDVELSDESGDEDVDEAAGDAHRSPRRHSEGIPESHYQNHYPHIPEEDETAEDIVDVPSSSEAGKTVAEDRSATIVPPLPSAARTIPVPVISRPMPSPDSDGGHIVPSEDYIVPSPGLHEEDLPTATADRTTFPDVPFVASPDPSPNLSAYSGTEPSPMPPLAPPPASIVAPPSPAAASAAAREKMPDYEPTTVSASTPVPTVVAIAPSPPTPPVPVPSPPPVVAPVLIVPSAPTLDTHTIMPGSLNPLSPMTPENEPARASPTLEPAPSIVSVGHSTVKLAPVATRSFETLPADARSGMPSPGLPLPSPSASSATGSLGFTGSSGIQQTLTPATTAGFSTPGQDTSPTASQTGARKSPSSHPSEWTMEEVIDWLKSKGFDQFVCDRFIEQEVTGDVLLELTPAILKDEIGIVKWGQRQRIANAITELRRPRSFTEYDQHPMHKLQTSRSQSLNYGHSHTSSMQSSVHQSFNNSPVGYVGSNFSPAHSTHATSTSSINVPSAHSPGFNVFGRAESPLYSIPAPVPEVPMGPVLNGWATPEPGLSGQASEVTLNSGRQQEATSQAVVQPIRQLTPHLPAHLASPASAPSELVGLGLGAGSTPPTSRPQSQGTIASKSSKTRPGHVSSSSISHPMNVIAVQDQHAEEDRGAISEPEGSQQDRKTKKRRIFGRSTDTASLKEKPASLKEKDGSHRLSKDSTVIATPTDSASKISAGDEVAPTRRPSKKKLSDDRKGTERISFFGGSIAGAIGKKTRKPVPRLSSSSLGNEKSEKSDKTDQPHEKAEKSEKGDHDWTSLATFSRIRHHNSERKASGRPATSDGSSKRKEDKGSTSSVLVDEKKKDQALLRKRTSSTSEPGTRTPAPPTSPQPAAPVGMKLKAGKSILGQIGTPDHNGWMRKKSDHYNSWKLRYFVLKGPHLYCLKSNDKSETKIKGYINIVGYKVVADENIDPGRYGFRIIHESDKTHYFSHDEKLIIREWMKALMKATINRDYASPVISSSNIPTIPLTVAQAMNPSPRPPSPMARAATQRAHRRENPNQLSSRDAQVLLMAMPSSKPPSPTGSPLEHERARVESFFATSTVASSLPGSPKNIYSPLSSPKVPSTKAASPKVLAPPRPLRETRRKVATPTPDENIAVDDGLIEWANLHLPEKLRITDSNGPLCNGLGLLRITEHIKGTPASPPVPDSAFPSGPNDEKLDGLFALFDFLLDNDVKIGTVSINEIRQVNRGKIVQVLSALKAWEEKRNNVAASGDQTSSSFAAGPVPYF